MREGRELEGLTENFGSISIQELSREGASVKRLAQVGPAPDLQLHFLQIWLLTANWGPEAGVVD